MRKKKKCELYREEITFLGHVIGKGKIMMDRKKVQMVLERVAPMKVADL